ncbi:D-alanyl-D-alanine carboxypeptidase family protein [uncultured Ruminococcus sp.]|uniref:D-alanyl-D-alanine carboxypeptidase family protein n=1 Tax=uncultured Ruminococcus sp. TaxID=165186 RepID=UPI0025DF78E7|nr:serine hydrolase [uncultured Ruminococcus sp.]
MKNKLRVISALLCAVLIFADIGSFRGEALSFVPTAVDADGERRDIKLYSECVYMVNMDSGDVIVDINGEKEVPPASLTKLMTAVVLLDELGGDESTLKNRMMSAGTEAFDELYDTGAATADIQPNESVSAYDLLAALLIPSACEAANIIAINVGGNVPAFVDMMNEKSAELGLKHTHFSNAHGLFTQQNFSTAKDISTICRYALNKYPVFRELVGSPSFTMAPTDYHPEGTYIVSTDYMINEFTDYYYTNCRGIKTGTTEAAGRCFASYATFDGMTYMAVTMGAPMEKLPEDIKKGEEDPDSMYADDVVYYNFIDHINLYEWAFDTLVQKDFINEFSEVRDVKVGYGKKRDYANLKPACGYSRMWPANIPIDDVEKKITVLDNIVAPVEEGDVLGKMELSYKGETLAVIDLISTTKVERSPVKERARVVKAYFGSKLFKITGTIVLVCIGLYCVLCFLIAQRKYLRKLNPSADSRYDDSDDD